MVEKRKKPKFLRRDWNRKIRFGGRKKLKWRWTFGRHNKIRQHMKNRPKMPSAGFGSPREIRGLVMGMNPVHISNIEDLKKIGQKDIGVISATVGNKKRIEIAEKAKGIKFMNFNPEKFLQENKIKKAEKKAEVKQETKKPEIKQEKTEAKKEPKHINKAELKKEIEGEEKK